MVVRGTCLAFGRRAAGGVPHTPPPVSFPELGEGSFAPLAPAALELPGALCPLRGGEEVVKATC